jgi:hypothetical protein
MVRPEPHQPLDKAEFSLDSGSRRLGPRKKFSYRGFGRGAGGGGLCLADLFPSGIFHRGFCRTAEFAAAALRHWPLLPPVSAAALAGAGGESGMRLAAPL